MSLIKFLAKYEDIQSINRTHSGKALSAYALEKNREHYQSLAWYQYKPYVRFLQAVVVMLISFGLLFLGLSWYVSHYCFDIFVNND